MPGDAADPRQGLFRDLGKAAYEWHKNDVCAIVNNADNGDCDIEIERMIELIGYVENKKRSSR